MSRETGRLLRSVQRGTVAFVQLLNIVVFNTLPLLFKVVMVSATLYILYGLEFLLINGSSMFFYFIVNYYVTEWRAKYFKDK